jgi:hypothetical protein
LQWREENNILGNFLKEMQKISSAIPEDFFWQRRKKISVDKDTGCPKKPHILFQQKFSWPPCCSIFLPRGTN